MTNEDFENTIESFYQVFSLRMKASEEVVNLVKELIMAGKLKPGDRLPTEVEFSKMLNLSRVPIREAMKILSALGLVEIRRGDGTYISYPFKKQLIDPLLLNLMLTDPKIEDLVELRELIELGMIDLILKKAERKDLKKLADVHLEMKKVVEAKADAYLITIHDLAFHKALGSATNNIMIKKIYEFAMNLFCPYIEKTHQKEEGQLVALRVHQSILDAILEGNYQKAVEAFKISIYEWRRLVID